MCENTGKTMKFDAVVLSHFFLCCNYGYHTAFFLAARELDCEGSPFLQGVRSVIYRVRTTRPVIWNIPINILLKFRQSLRCILNRHNGARTYTTVF